MRKTEQIQQKQQNNAVITKETTMFIDGCTFKVVTHFKGTETASKLLYDMAVSRILNEPVSTVTINDDNLDEMDDIEVAIC